MTAAALDLGDGHTLRWTSWAPDRTLNPQYDGPPDVPRYGAIVSHPAPEGYRGAGDLCEGAITLDSDVARRIEPGRPMWTVVAWEPLTLAPSLLCQCGDHGWIQGGRWVRA